MAHEEITVIQAFENRANESPLSPALETSDGKIINYRNLSGLVNKVCCEIEKIHAIAHKNQTLPALTFVPILLEDGVKYVSATLGVLKSGLIFVPMDPSQPIETLRTILQDLNSSILITENSQAELVKSLEFEECKIESAIWIDSLLNRPTETEKVEDNFSISESGSRERKYSESDVMFCLYTSGTTGKPKGVLIENISVMNWIRWFVEDRKLTSKDRSLAFSSPTFDISICQIFPFLSIGATVVLPPSWTNLNKLPQRVQQTKVTFLYLPTIVAETFFELNPLDFPHLKCIQFGGEMLRKYGNTQAQSINRTGKIQLVNCYGPTEATLCVTAQVFCPGEMLTLSVGKAIPNHKIYILDENMEPIFEPRIIGNVYIEGIGVSKRGYHNRPDSNQSYFVQHNGKLLAKTGDLGIWRSDDGETLEIRGRSDDQIKISGIRLEITEIEFHLTQFPGINEAIVTYDSGTQEILAHITQHSTQNQAQTVEFDKNELEIYLKDRIPKVALPSQYHILSKIPLNTSGKADKKKLLELAKASKLDDDVNIILNNVKDAEIFVIGIWSKVLNVSKEAINVDSNFFELGGDSFKVQQLISTIKAQIPNANSTLFRFATIFNNPCVNQQAAKLFSCIKNKANCPAPKVNNNPSNSNNQLPLPLSIGQEQLWLSMLEAEHDEHENSSCFNVLRKIQFNHPINVVKLQNALKKIIVENPGSRASFHKQQQKQSGQISQSKQIIKSNVDSVPKIDLIDIVDENKIRDLLSNFRFNLTEGNLYKFFISTSTSSKPQLFFVLYHHLLMDGYGWNKFIQSLDLYYSEDCKFELDHTPKNSCSYTSTILFEHNNQHNNDSQSETYWIQKLKNLTPIRIEEYNYNFQQQLKLPSISRSYVLIKSLSSTLSAQLLQLAQSNQTTLFAVLLAIYKILIYRHTQNPDQTILTLWRTGTSPENVLGYFVNAIPIRTNTNLVPMTTVSFLKSVSQAVAEGLDHGHVPFQKVLGLCSISGEKRDELLQYWFQMIPTLSQKLQNCTEILMTERNAGSPKIDFGMEVNSNGAELQLALEYNSDKFSKCFVQRFLDRFEELCKSVICDRENRNLDQLNVLPFAEKDKILNTFAFAKTMQKSEIMETPCCSILNQFQAQVTQNPKSIAIQDHTQNPTLDLTYDELEKLSDFVAQKILSFNFDFEYLIILLPKNYTFIISTIAGMKTDRILVPLSITAPPSHIQSILEDLGESWVFVVSKETVNLIPKQSQKYILIDDVLKNYVQLQHQQQHLSLPAKNPNNVDISYCFFTSGTTGRPKGVLIKKSSLKNCIHNYISSFNIDSSDSCLFFHNPAFDASLMDFLPGLVQGAQILIPNSELSYDPTNLWKFICNEKITFANVPTVIAQSLFNLNHKICRDFCYLRYLVFGGEKLKVCPPLDFPVKNCINAYGPTETTVDATHSWLTCTSGSNNSIGRPLQNVHIYILDRFLQPVPLGVKGVIWIGGAGVAHGYLNRPELTEKLFKKDPFQSSGQMFNSGDFGLWNDDGTISVYSRTDQQVKINGIRIELEEIETFLNSHEQIKESAVVPIQQSTSKTTTTTAILVAYFVPTNSNNCNSLSSAKILRNFLKDKVPYYAIPTEFIPVKSSLPLTQNMKIDRANLVQNFLQNSKNLENSLRTSLTKTENLLAKIWSKHLNVDINSIFPHTNFYMIGGSSIIIISLIHEIKSTFTLLEQINLNFRDLLQTTTLESQAEYVDCLIRKITTTTTMQTTSENLTLTTCEEQNIYNSIYLEQQAAADFEDIQLKKNVKENMYPLFFNAAKPETEKLITVFQLEDRAKNLEIWTGLIAKILSLLLQIPIRKISKYIQNPALEPVLHLSLSNLLLFHNTLMNLSKASSEKSTQLQRQLYHIGNLKNLIKFMSQYSVSSETDSPINCIFENELEIMKRQLTSRMEKQTQYSPNPEESTVQNFPCPKVIFLTGSTGYLGAFILENLLQNSSVEKIYCLVRGNPNRLEESLQKFQIKASNSNMKKIQVLTGDLSLKKFGLEPDLYAELLNNVELICHCGALVNLIALYKELEGPNVHGTLELCKLALDGLRIKSFHYVSSSDSIVGKFAFETEDQLMEPILPNHPPYMDTGYYQTKWISEKLVEFISSKVPSIIWRVGTVGATSDDERQIFNSSSFDGIFIRACTKLQAYPDFKGWTVPYSDVDWAARTICDEFSTNSSSKLTPLMIMNVVQKNYCFSDLFQRAFPGLGQNITIQSKSYKLWYDQFQIYNRKNPADTLSQQLLILFNQNPWGVFLKDFNYYSYLSKMPRIGYPKTVSVGLKSMTKILDTGEDDFNETSIGKYMHLHSRSGLIENFKE